MTDTSPPRSRLAFWSVAAVFSVVMAGTTLPSPLFGLYEQRLHISSLSVTVIYGIYAAGVVLALLVLASFGSAFGLRARLATSLALCAASAAVFLVTSSVVPLVAARLLSGFAAGLASGTATAAMIQLGGVDARARSAVIAIGVSFGGLSVGSVVAGAVSELGSAALTLPFVAGLIACAAVAPALLSVSNGSPRVAAATARAGASGSETAESGAAGRGAARGQDGRAGDRGPAPAPFSSPRIRRVFLQAVVPGGVGFAANGLVAAITAVFLSKYLGLEDRALAGLVLAILFSATAAGQLFVRRVPTRLVSIVGASGLISGLALLAATMVAPSLPGLIAASVVVGASAGVCAGAGLVSLAIVVPAAHLTTVTARYYVVLYACITVPVIGNGLIAQRAGVASAGLIVCLTLAAAVGVVLVSLFHDRPGGPT